MSAKARKQLNKPLDLKAMPKAKVRVEIAKDVLAALDLKRLTAAPGAYFTGEIAGRCITKVVPLRETLPEMKTCSVCALGSCLVALVARDNDFDVIVQGDKVFHVGGSEAMVKKLAPYFSELQLAMVEAAFERTNHPVSARNMFNNHPSHFAACRFGQKIEKEYPWPANDGSRFEFILRAIMQNIIDNEGTFVP